MMPTPTLINLPPPPSDPVTPSDIPGTPNSTTTSLSALSTTAIKDGHQGHAPHPHHNHASSTSSTNTLDAERADRISRLAGLERVATARQGAPPTSNLTPVQAPPPGYFDHASTVLNKDRSTVGSASATGSVGGRTTWADGSEAFEDKMSEDQDDGVSSAGLSDEGNASLVGFGEGAGSTVSGPISTGRFGLTRTGSGVESPSAAKGFGPGSPMQGVQREGGKGFEGGYVGEKGRNANMTGQETAERIVRERQFQSRNGG
ncbi:hypothetical protein MMC30_008458 [Trapelia coarctata]|nr:hypothetical protein [Trapelia coarctata]